MLLQICAEISRTFLLPESGALQTHAAAGCRRPRSSVQTTSDIDTGSLIQLREASTTQSGINALKLSVQRWVSVHDRVHEPSCASPHRSARRLLPDLECGTEPGWADRRVERGGL